MTPAVSRSRARRIRPVLAVAVTALLAACAAAEAATGDVVPGAAPSSPPTPALAAPVEPAAETPAAQAEQVETERPTVRVGPRLRVALRSAAAWEGRATYRLTRADGATADVAVFRAPGAVRLDVTVGGATSSLLGGSGGWVACQSTERASCVVAAPAGAALPAAFDPGLGELMFTTLPALADRGLGVADAGWVAGVRDAAGNPVAAAACAEVLGRHAGEYCLTEAGLLRRAALESGTLTLLTSHSEVHASVFTPPATPVPLA